MQTYERQISTHATLAVHPSSVNQSKSFNPTSTYNHPDSGIPLEKACLFRCYHHLPFNRLLLTKSSPAFHLLECLQPSFRASQQ
jgi:hypothetical protein